MKEVPDMTAAIAQVFILVDRDGVAHIRGPDSAFMRDLVSRSFRCWRAGQEVNPVPEPGEVDALMIHAGRAGYDVRTRVLS